MDANDFDRTSPVYGLLVSVSHGNLKHPIAGEPPCGTVDFVSVVGATTSHAEIENRIIALQQLLRTWGMEICKVTSHGQVVFDAYSGKSVSDQNMNEQDEEILAAMKEKPSATH